jgi:uncharacterized damage-inducible protein DinB
MPNDRDVLYQMTKKALSGEDSHVKNVNVLAGLDWKLSGVRPEGAPHSLFQLVNHMIYWQVWMIRWLDGKRPRVPRHASGSWPGRVGPANRREWERTVRRFRNSLHALHRRSRQGDLLANRGKVTRLEMLHLSGSHTSYHVGQVAFLRQQLGSWPPPSGGVTW